MFRLICRLAGWNWHRRMKQIRVDGPEIHVSRSVSVIYARAWVYPAFCRWYTSGSETMEYCIDLCTVTSDILTWQFVWCAVGGTDILGCNIKFLYVFKIHVQSQFFLVSGLCRTFWSICTIYVRHHRHVSKAANPLKHPSQKVNIWWSGWNQHWKIKSLREGV